MSARFASRPGIVGSVLAAVFCLALLLHGQDAFAAEGLTFNPTLSLTGDCSVKNKVDRVPDPGCPGGTHPATGFFTPSSVSTDSHGDVYVFNQAEQTFTVQGISVMDIFSPSGHFITEVPLGRASTAAVDSNGVIYCSIIETPPGGTAKESLARLEPTTFEPASQEIAYAGSFVSFFDREEGLEEQTRIAVDPADDHIFGVVVPSNGSIEAEVREWGSAAEGNPDNGIVVDTGQLAGKLAVNHWISVGPDHRLYLSGGPNNLAPAEVFSYSLGAGGTYELSMTLKGPTPTTTFSSETSAGVSTAVDTANGDFFVNDIGASSRTKALVYEFDEEGNLLATIKPPVGAFEPVNGNAQIAVDNGSAGPNAGNLLVPSSEELPAHLLVFEPSRPVEPPEIESLDVSGITRDEANATATIEPNGSAGTYRFELTTGSAHAERGFAGATVGVGGALPTTTVASQVSAAIEGLQPGTGYVLRVEAAAAGCAEAACEAEKVASFSTFPETGIGIGCPNEMLRSATSKALPDCRAYELVSPPSTAGHQLVSPGLSFAAPSFATPVATNQGDNLAFTTSGGSIPGLGGLGGLYGSGYVSQWTPSGWITTSVEPDGSLATRASAGSLSPDHAISTESVAEGPMHLAESGESGTYYLGNPSGAFELLGGSLGVEPGAQVSYISPGNQHVFFRSGFGGAPARQLEPEAPAAGIPALYDRTADGVTHAISVLPGGVQPSPTDQIESIAYARDGSVVSFRYSSSRLPNVGGPLYVRVDNQRTVEAAPDGAMVEGISNTGESLFYLLGGSLYRFDIETGTTETVVGSGDATVVNLAGSGRAAYFVSPSVLDSRPNSMGSISAPGAENLYLWRLGGGIRFVAGVTARDVAGETGSIGEQLDGLGLWSTAVAESRPALVPAQSTESGAILLFESRAPITGYESKASAAASEGEPEIFRFDAATESIICVSCDPSGQRPLGPASLLTSQGRSFFPRKSVSDTSVVPNLSESGERVIFQTVDPLVPEDANGVQDVYEWETAGTGNCSRASGCVALLSRGTSSQPSYLFGLSGNGNDAFILTSDQLTRTDGEATASIYDAKVEGGFAEQAPPAPCEAEGCRAPLSESPNLSPPGSSSTGAGGNVVESTKPKPKPKKSKHKKKKHSQGKHHSKKGSGKKKSKSGKGGQR
jgi:hypothetical protein